MLATLVLVALMGLTIANPLDLQAREDVKVDNFDLCRLLGCHRPPTVTRTLIYTITSTSISSATATATVTTTVDCSSSAPTHETTTSDFASTETTATTATSTDTDSVTLPETTALTTTIASTNSTTSADTTSAEITVAPTTLTDTTSTDISSAAGVTSWTNVTIPTNTTSINVATSTGITIPTNATTATGIAIPTNTIPANMTISVNTTVTTTTAAETTEITTSAATPTTAASTSSTTRHLSPQVTPAPFNCSADAYFIQDRTLLRVNLQTGAKTTISARLGGASAKVNAIGFNPFDNFIYGLQGKTVVRVASDGALQAVVRGHTAANAGDIDADGQFYYSAGGRAWGRVDLRPGSPRFGQLVARGVSDSSALPRGLAVADWAFTPAAPGYLHSVAVDAHGVVYLVRWDLGLHMWEVRHKGLPSSGVRGSAFGAVVATSDGVLYASHKRSGAVLRIPLDNPEGTSEVKVLVTGAGFSDGCRCATKPDVAV